MPDCPPERLAILVEALEGLEVVPFWERTPDFLCLWINQGAGAEILGSTAMRYFCRCTRESLLTALQGFGPAERSALFKEGSPISVRCDYCGRDYAIVPADLEDAGGRDA
jgi:redox-regulated HSP33 family molecular chaperone